MSSVSIICVYNNSDVLNDCLLKGLRNQSNQDYELILIDNRKNEFSSAAKALNYGASKATTNHLVFSHQDIRMDVPTVIDTIIKYFDSNLKVFGSSGVCKFNAKMISNVYTANYDDNFYANKLCKRINEPVLVETLDECFFCIDKDTFYSLGKFDEILCDNWHMYCVDLSLTAKERGVKVYSVPLTLFHKSGGVISKNFIYNLKAVCKKHHLIWAAMPCYHFLAFSPFMWLLYYYWQLSYSLERKRKSKAKK